MRGANVDLLNPAGDPEPSALKAAGFDQVRLVSKPDSLGPGVHPHIEERLAQYRAAGIKALVVITNESQGRIPANHHGIVQCGNEPDGQPPSSMVMTKDDYVAMFNTYSGAHPEITWICAGLCSGDPQWWYDIMPRLNNCHALAVHLYGKTLGSSKDLIAAYKLANGAMPVYVTEWNRSAIEIPAYDWWLRQNTDGAYWFCWSDGMVSPFGLVDAQGKPKAELGAFNPLAKPPTPEPKPPTPAPVTRIAAPPITYKLLDGSHYDYSSTPRSGLKIAGCTNHIADGYGSLYGWFSSQQLSTNYWIGRDGRIECYVLDEHAAYGQGLISLGSEFPPDFVRACGGKVTSASQGYLANCLYLSVEHEGHPQDGLSDIQLTRSRWLNRWLAQEHNYPFDADHVVGHYRFDHVNRARCGRFVPQVLGASGNGAA